MLERDSLAALAIEIRFRGENDGETRLQLPDAWGGKTRLYQNLRDLTVTGGTMAAMDSAPSLRILRHAPGARLIVRYRVVQGWPGVPAAGGNEYRPVIQRGYFHVIGNAIFAHPEWDDSSPVTFSVKGLPRGWRFASDLEHGPLKLGGLLESVAVGGDFRVIRRGPLRVAIRGEWPFSDSAFVERLRPIIASHHRFWGDPETPYLVTVLPLHGETGQSSLGGTGLSDAFAFFATPNTEEATLQRVLAHEHLHTWIPRRVGVMSEGAMEPADYWLSEGFTDFYTQRLLLRDGLITPEQYADAFNEVLAAYAASPVRTEPNARVIADFWNDRDVQKLPYQRGFLIAALWDWKLSVATHDARNLDDVMLAMKAAADRATGRPPLASRLLVDEIGRLGVDVTGDVALYIERGGRIVLPREYLAPCARIETADVAEFSRGFDAQKTSQNGNVVTDLDPESPGFRAGLRNGMKILERKSGRVGDSTTPLLYRVLDGETEREITYLPEGHGRLTIQKLVIEGGRPDCAVKFSGAIERP